eukprot:TRINITY_DN2743_c0_g1_i2.p1 TRINITY_DN2743_c0_g1~~TRINITY_DN2743_c0_g1_i2.p1  ORF type:complete len:383 (+),score=77.92 TRINITY_DN2743_c0_g1_i2:308-1456(+)
MVLTLTERFDESKTVCEKGIEVCNSLPSGDQSVTSTKNELETSLKRVIQATKLNTTIPKGCWIQVPILYGKSPYPIDWESIYSVCDIYINRGATGLWSLSPASELSTLSIDEAVQFTKNVVDRCKPRKIPVISGVKQQTSLESLASHMKVLQDAGADSIVLSTTNLLVNNNVNVVLDNLKKLSTLLQQNQVNVPLGLYESNEDTKSNGALSTTLLRSIAESGLCWYYFDNTSSMMAINNKLNTISDLHHCFRMFVGNSTALLSSLKNGCSGFGGGEGASFMPSLYSWLCKNFKDDTSSQALSSFISLSEPTIKLFFPLNLKLFIQIHFELSSLEIATRQESLMALASDETITRITHLHDAAIFVENSLKEMRGKKKDSSVLL